MIRTVTVKPNICSVIVTGMEPHPLSEDVADRPPLRQRLERVYHKQIPACKGNSLHAGIFAHFSYRNSPAMW